jgi:hypothetical protein
VAFSLVYVASESAYCAAYRTCASSHCCAIYLSFPFASLFLPCTIYIGFGHACSSRSLGRAMAFQETMTMERGRRRFVRTDTERVLMSDAHGVAHPRSSSPLGRACSSSSTLWLISSSMELARVNLVVPRCLRPICTLSTYSVLLVVLISMHAWRDDVVVRAVDHQFIISIERLLRVNLLLFVNYYRTSFFDELYVYIIIWALF